MKPYSIRIFLPHGVPDGLRLVEKSNWSGLGIVCPRSLFGEAKSRSEFTRTGVYVLVGESETSVLVGTTYAPNGKKMVELNANAENTGGMVSVFNKTGEDVVQLGVDEYGNGVVGAYNRKGKGRTLKSGP